MFVGCQGLHGDDPIGVGRSREKSLEIESHRYGLVAKGPRSLKRVDFIAVTGLGFWNKIDGEGEALQSAFTFNVVRVVVVGVGRSSCVALLSVASLQSLSVVLLNVAAS